MDTIIYALNILTENALKYTFNEKVSLENAIITLKCYILTSPVDIFPAVASFLAFYIIG